MPWVYEQSTGKLFRPNGEEFVQGHAGRGEEHLNNPASQCIINWGPIPRGDWTMTVLHNAGPQNNTRTQNPLQVPQSNSLYDKRYIIRLMPQAGTNVCGRSGFLIHGGNIGDSQGCIIVNSPSVRKTIWDSGDRELRVVDVQENTP